MFAERYAAGESQQVWSELTTLGAAVREEPLYFDALAVARETMRRVRHNIKLLHERLITLDYEFIYPDLAFVAQSKDVQSEIAEVERLAGTLPLSLRAWYEMIKSVTFIGYHPLLSSYYDHDHDGPYSDPLHVDPLSYGLNQIEPEQRNPDGSYRWDIAPDFYHKANVSGGSPILIELPSPQMDARLRYWPSVEQEHPINFIDYLRLAIKWGGFPGMELYTSPEFSDWTMRRYMPAGWTISADEIAFLTADLLPF